MHKQMLQTVWLLGALTVPAPSLAQITPTTSEPVPPVAARGAGATSAIDDSTLARSARASKLIGSRLYANDASSAKSKIF